MRASRRFRFYSAAAVFVFVWTFPAFGQRPSYVVISPAKVTLVVGETRSFRLVNQDGQMQRYVSWNVSDTDALQETEGDEVTITAKRPGDYHLSARAKSGAAEASITVVAGALATGDVIWSEGKIPDCKATKIIQAVPTANGPALYEQSNCEDGQYVAAYTADGIQMWRRKVSDMFAKGASKNKNSSSLELPAIRLDVHSTSICDSIPTGSEQQKVRELVSQRGLSISEARGDQTMWTIDESNTQCVLWFDDKLAVSKKRKAFVAQ